MKEFKGTLLFTVGLILNDKALMINRYKRLKHECF